MRQLPAGTVTFLFTDVEGSTRLLADHAERYAQLLAEHRRVLREAFARHGGVEVDTQGDAFFVAFTSAREAIAAAAEARDALGARPITVRMGMHTGEAALTEEGYVGLDVHRAARICSAAHGGQVVLSQRTLELVDGVPVRDLGRHRLKDLAEPERLYQLGELEFPPLRSLNATNLPTQPTVLVGRECELEETIALLRRQDVRLLTLTGAGGSGKTRLALQLAAELVDDFPGGVFWVPLAALTDPDLVLPTIAQTLGAKDGVRDHIDERRMLLLDNLEQILPAAPALGDLLAGCPNLRLLVTSRTVLRLAAEQEYEVPPLQEVDAVTMFTQRARAVRPEFEPDVHVTDICRRLDRLPLAIELAAARVRVLSTQELASRLERRLPLLTGGARDAPERQRTLRATIEWSHDLLAPAQRRLFARLAVFGGSFTAEAADAVCGCDFDGLSQLVEHSLVRRWSSGRFGMLETIREFAVERFEELEEVEEVRRRHLANLLELAEEANPEVEGMDREGLERLGAERDNIRGALEWSLSSGDPVQGLRLAVAMGRFWVIRGYVEGHRWLAEALARAEAAPPDLRAEGCLWAGSCLFFTREYAGTGALFEESLSLFRELGDIRYVASVLDRLAAAQLALDRVEDARASTEESLALFEQLGDRRGSMYPLNKLAELERRDGRREAATAALERSSDLAREFDDRWWLAGNLLSLAEWTVDDGDASHAAELCREAVAITRELGNRHTLMYGLALLACVAAARREPAAAGRLWGALELLEREGEDRLDPRDRAHYAELIRVVEGPEFSAAAEESRRMSEEEAIEEALARV